MSNGQCLVKVEFDETVTDACDDCYERVVQWLLSCEHNDLYTYGPWTLREPVPYNISREAACRLMKAEPGQRQQLYNNIQYAEKVLAYYRANPIPPPSHVLYYYQQAFRSLESANERQMSWKAEKADMNRELVVPQSCGTTPIPP
ncbi:hypothetical protein V499_03174 [Pseudogymnoascus sp. VKM F-103]|nr:hypothetical protein V499_03174 [Pseudogymnoascus sp. VKM F-103]